MSVAKCNIFLIWLLFTILKRTSICYFSQFMMFDKAISFIISDWCKKKTFTLYSIFFLNICVYSSSLAYYISIFKIWYMLICPICCDIHLYSPDIQVQLTAVYLQSIYLFWRFQLMDWVKMMKTGQRKQKHVLL